MDVFLPLDPTLGGNLKFNIVMVIYKDCHLGSVALEKLKCSDTYMILNICMIFSFNIKIQKSQKLSNIVMP